MAYLIERSDSEFDDADGNKIVAHGKIVAFWRKDSQGQWKKVVDMWNETTPPAE